jgi:hypothetical protein
MKLLNKLVATAAMVFGDLTDGSLNIGSVAGEWSLYVNAGDNVTITARRLQATDIWSFATYGAVAYNPFSGNPAVVSSTYGVGWGDDNLPANPGYGGSFGDPQYTFTASISGLVTVWVDQCCGQGGNPLAYNVQATGSTGSSSVPDSGSTFTLMGVALFGATVLRRKLKSA